jgi:two-component system OmpR family response regulator
MPRLATRPARLSVLVVDDYVEAADSLADLLAAWGHEARVAYSAAAASLSAAADPPDAAVIEVRLAAGGGDELVRRLGAASPPPLIVALTGWADEVARRHSAEAGVKLHLVKPAEPAAIRAALDEFARLPAHPHSFPTPDDAPSGVSA